MFKHTRLSTRKKIFKSYRKIAAILIGMYIFTLVFIIDQHIRKPSGSKPKKNYEICKPFYSSKINDRIVYHEENGLKTKIISDWSEFVGDDADHYFALNLAADGGH
jgi:hypothetical protein